MAFKALVTSMTSSALSLQPHDCLTFSSSKLDTCCLRAFALAVACVRKALPQGASWLHFTSFHV